MDHRLWPAVLLLVPALATAQQAPASPKSQDPWIRDYELARSRARDGKRDLLMLFFGPAADGSDQRLEREVLARPEFLTAAGKLFVLARFDYPKDTSRIPEVLQRQNARLLAKYHVERLPAIWLEDHNGSPYARVGYLPLDAKAFVALLDRRQQAQQQAAAAFARAATLRGIERAKALAEGLRLLDDHVVATAHYRQMLEVIELDQDGAAGLKPEFDAIARDAAARPFRLRLADELGALVTKQDWAALDERIAAARQQHAGARWAEQYLTYLQGIRKADGDHDDAAALELFTAALALAPRSELAPEIDLRRARAAAAVEQAAEKARQEEAKQKGRKKPGRGRGGS